MNISFSHDLVFAVITSSQDQGSFETDDGGDGVSFLDCGRTKTKVAFLNYEGSFGLCLYLMLSLKYLCLRM
jgi:hypothetical protein